MTRKMYRFTDEEITDLSIVAAEEGALAGLLAMWKMIEPDWESMESVNPSDYGISRADMDRVFGALNRGPGSGDPFFGTSLMMEFVNRGPSIVEEV